jgi:hypothetical protein
MDLVHSPLTPLKIIEPEWDLVTAQLGIVLINPTKFHQYLTKGFEEKPCEQNFQRKYFKVP